MSISEKNKTDPVRWSGQPGLTARILSGFTNTGVYVFLKKMLIPVMEFAVALILPIWRSVPWLRDAKFLSIPVQHIGHLATEVDCFLKEEILGLHPHYNAIVISPSHLISNPALVRYFRAKITFITNPLLGFLMRPFSRTPELQFDVTKYAQIINGTSTAPIIHKKWGNRNPLWQLTAVDQVSGYETLEALGVPEGAWFVCVVCREYGYQKWAIQNYRDVDIENYIPAMQTIVKKGGYVLRMGDPSMRNIPKIPGIIDYCHSPLRSDWMDIFLCAKCKFFLGSTGISWVSSIFGVPVASANLAPLSAVLYMRPGDIAIPKLYWSTKENRYLTFEEILTDPMGDFRFAQLYEKAGIDLVQNSPDEIRDLAIEMLDQIESRITYSEEDEMLQSEFVSLMKPGHFTYGSAARCGRDFLRKYRHLLV